MGQEPDCKNETTTREDEQEARDRLNHTLSRLLFAMEIKGYERVTQPH
jgi:hypothetical protein